MTREMTEVMFNYKADGPSGGGKSNLDEKPIMEYTPEDLRKLPKPVRKVVSAEIGRRVEEKMRKEEEGEWILRSSGSAL